MSTHDFELEQDNGLVIARIGWSQLGLAEIDTLIEELRTRMRFDGAVRFILDMENVKFLGSACLGALVEFLQDVQSHGGRIVLAACEPEVQFLFKVTRLDSVFTLFDDVYDARSSFESRTFLGGTLRM